jgi:hypothetical protein
MLTGVRIKVIVCLKAGRKNTSVGSIPDRHPIVGRCQLRQIVATKQELWC